MTDPEASLAALFPGRAIIPASQSPQYSGLPQAPGGSTAGDQRGGPPCLTLLNAP